MPPESEIVDDIDLPEFESFHRIDHHDVDHHDVDHHDVDHVPAVEPLSLFTQPRVVELPAHQVPANSFDHNNFQPQSDFQIEQTPQRVVQSNHHFHQQQTSESSDHSNLQQSHRRIAQPNNRQPVSQGFDQKEFQVKKTSQKVIPPNPEPILKESEAQVQNIQQIIAQSNFQTEFQVQPIQQRINNLPDPRLPRQRANQGITKKVLDRLQDSSKTL